PDWREEQGALRRRRILTARGGGEKLPGKELSPVAVRIEPARPRLTSDQALGVEVRPQGFGDGPPVELDVARHLLRGAHAERDVDDGWVGEWEGDGRGGERGAVALADLCDRLRASDEVRGS